MKLIPLTHGKFAQVDDADFEQISKYKWHSITNKSGNNYAICSIKINGKFKTTYMHRMILGVTEKSDWVDHKDNNGLNNRRTNIRIATPSKNQANRIPFGNSKYKGVCFNKNSKLWRTEIQKDGKRITIGYFKDEKQAALAYDLKATELFGEFAYLNFKQSKSY
jgi:hypothetical protein